MFEKLFEPIQIGSITVKNRTVMAPMTTLYGGADGQVTEQAIEYYGARARGGTGMIIVEGIYISPLGLQIPCSMTVRDDKFVPGLASLADSIRRNGAVSVMQLIHSGVQAWVTQTVGPSEVGRIVGKPISTELPPKALTIAEIEGIVEEFGMAAFRAMMGGWDMIQVHGTHGYLIHQFLSPLTNKRTDKYGQDRDLFVLQVIEKIREKCGPNYPIIYRLNGDEALGDSRLKGGISLEDAKKTAKRLEDAGVDAFDVTGGQDDCIDQYVPSAYVLRDREGWFFHLSSEIKKVVNVPIISGGGIEAPEAAEKALNDGLTDMVFLGRQLIADADWAIKAHEDRPEDIRPCVYCLHCGNRILTLKPVNCTVNPLAGYEFRQMTEENFLPAKTKKRILVVGAGPGGMECARVASQRGHQVVLVDKNDRVGGTVNIAIIPDFKHKYRKWIGWYDVQMKKLGIDLRLKTEADSALLQEVDPDIVVMATGSKPLVGTIKGIENTVLADDVLLGRAQTGQTVAIIGLGLVGAETALFLAEQGKKITVLEELAAPPILMDLGGIALLKPGEGLFAKHGVEVLLGTKVQEISANEIVTVEQDGEKRMKIDTVIDAIGRESVLPEDLLANSIERGKKVFTLGDAKAPRKIKDAVEEAFMLASQL